MSDQAKDLRNFSGGTNYDTRGMCPCNWAVIFFGKKVLKFVRGFHDFLHFVGIYLGEGGNFDYFDTTHPLRHSQLFLNEKDSHILTSFIFFNICTKKAYGKVIIFCRHHISSILVYIWV